MQCKSCFFIGHREAGPDILPALEDTIEKHISEYGVTEFIVGHYGGFDRLAARALVQADLLQRKPSPEFSNTWFDICHIADASLAKRILAILYGKILVPVITMPLITF